MTGTLTLMAAAPAYAHDGLLSSSPEAGSTVTGELTSIDLVFSDDFLQLGTYTPAFAIQVSGSNGRFYNTDCVLLNGAQMSTPLELGESDQYTVVWQVISSDGHPASDTFSFTYQKPVETVAAEGSAIGQTCSDDPAAEVNQTLEPSATQTNSPPITADAQDTDGPGTDQGAAAFIIPIAGAAVVLGAIGIVVGRRMRRRGSL
jgi:methionine-rich copper-binding protein CopC